MSETQAMLAAAFLEWDSYSGADRDKYRDLIGLSHRGMREMKQLAGHLDS